MMLSGILLLSACESVRTVYDEYGEVVDTEAADSGSEGDFSARLEKQFSSAFSEKKNDKGVPQAISNRVSPYQKDLDASGRMDKEYSTGSYSGSKDEVYTVSFSDGKKMFSTSDAYSGAMGKSIDRDLHPDFATATRGVYGSEDSYIGGTTEAYQNGVRNTMGSRKYVTGESHYSRETPNGYVETRRNNTPPPRVITRDQYYRKTIEETRSLLGRDKGADN